MRIHASLALLTAAALLAPAGAAAAGDPGDQRAASASGRTVLVCQNDAATRRSFTRQYGSAPVFVTAREALATSPSDPAWDAPRCMTAREHARYAEAASTYARASR